MFGCKPITIEDALTAQARQLRGYRRLYPQPSTMRLWSGYRRHKSHILPTIAKCYGGGVDFERKVHLLRGGTGEEYRLYLQSLD